VMAGRVTRPAITSLTILEAPFTSA
jgi:hypothetical protein